MKHLRESTMLLSETTDLASLAACEQLKSAGLNTLLLTSTLEGEARHVGVMLASIATEVSVSGNPVPKPAGIIAGGETTVTVTGKGLGGRNQEIALAAASRTEWSERSSTGFAQHRWCRWTNRCCRSDYRWKNIDQSIENGINS